jgi:hypothetical protein
MVRCCAVMCGAVAVPRLRFACVLLQEAVFHDTTVRVDVVPGTMSEVCAAVAGRCLPAIVGSATRPSLRCLCRPACPSPGASAVYGGAEVEKGR